MDISLKSVRCRVMLSGLEPAPPAHRSLPDRHSFSDDGGEGGSGAEGKHGTLLILADFGEIVVRFYIIHTIRRRAIYLLTHNFIPRVGRPSTELIPSGVEGLRVT